MIANTFFIVDDHTDDDLSTQKSIDTTDIISEEPTSLSRQVSTNSEFNTTPKWIESTSNPTGKIFWTFDIANVFSNGKNN